MPAGILTYAETLRWRADRNGVPRILVSDQRLGQRTLLRNKPPILAQPRCTLYVWLASGHGKGSAPGNIRLGWIGPEISQRSGPASGSSPGSLPGTFSCAMFNLPILRINLALPVSILLEKNFKARKLITRLEEVPSLSRSVLSHPTINKVLL